MMKTTTPSIVVALSPTSVTTSLLMRAGTTALLLPHPQANTTILTRAIMPLIRPRRKSMSGRTHTKGFWQKRTPSPTLSPTSEYGENRACVEFE